MGSYVSVGPAANFREEKIRRFFIDGHEVGVVLYNGRFYAFSNRCTHNDFQLHFGFIEDGCIWCPIHYGVFDIETGAAKGGPVTDLQTYAVRVVDGDVQVSVDEAASPPQANASGTEAPA